VSTSGQLITSREEHRECHIAIRFSYGLVDLGCGFAGFVEVIDDPETLTSFWACPTCREGHEGGIGT
jgi:hypothetical protein